MEVVVILDSGFEKELSVTVPWEMVGTEYESIVKRYSQLPIRGFRQGRTPIGLIESSFAQQIKNDLLLAVSTRLCRKALHDKDMVAGTPVEISDSLLQKNKYLKFKAAFIAMPEFDLPDYHRLDLQSDNKEEKTDEISQKLLEHTDISLHPCYIENELKYSENENGGEADRNDAEKRVKLMLILKSIARQDKIEIDEKEINDRIRNVAQENEVKPEELQEFLTENNGLARFADILLAEAVLEYIAEIQH